MKLTITTLTGEKFDVEVKAEDKVKDVKVSAEVQIIKDIKISNEQVSDVILCEDMFETVLTCVINYPIENQ